MAKNVFIQKIKGFVKRNAYALVVSFCVLVVFTVATALTVADLYKVEDTSVPVENNEEVAPTQASDVVFDCPVKNPSISKEYAEDHLLEDKTTGVWKVHKAIDYAGTSETAVYAVYDGTVEKVEKDVMDGTVITLKISENIKAVYKSLGSSSVNVGDSVKKGDELGFMGTSTTEKAEGIHLHFEVLKDGKLVDPNQYFALSGK